MIALYTFCPRKWKKIIFKTIFLNSFLSRRAESEFRGTSLPVDFAKTSGWKKMGRARNDSYSQPQIESHRRQIGRQDSKKEKKHLKHMSSAEERKNLAGKSLNQAFLIVVTVTLTGSLIYLFLAYVLKRWLTLKPARPIIWDILQIHIPLMW